ncbi:MAG: hypothetical protein FWG44_04555 [Oscillospiraceae bacterium]|nr:hypothetical protein [Oscillospiraceae bacterium]
MKKYKIFKRAAILIFAVILMFSVHTAGLFTSFAAQTSGFFAASSLEREVLPPDLLTMQDGTAVTTAAQWLERQKEIRAMLEYYMYGPWRSGEGETLSYTLTRGTLTTWGGGTYEADLIELTIEKDGKTAQFNVSYNLPDAAPPEDGFPVMVVFGGIGHADYINQKGYALITITDMNNIASDNAARNGEFYKLYPYSSAWEEQSGVLMAWSWGAGKILDALEQGLGAELNINTEKTIVTGVSRYGKAAAVAGAFDTRFAVTLPVCSGFGGLTMGRYKSNNTTYNLLPDFANDPNSGAVSNLEAWTSTGGTEGIQSLQGSGWFNENYKGFTTYSHVPFDQHFLSALCAMENRYLFMITGINSDMWNSPPGLWYNYEEALPAFELLGLEDNLAIQMHLNGHSAELEDLVKLFAYLDKHWNGKDFSKDDIPDSLKMFLADFKLDDLKTSVFASEANAEVYLAGKPNPEIFESAVNEAAELPIKIMLGDKEYPVTVTRNDDGDALIESVNGGFRFNYGSNLQYSDTFAKFDLTLPDGIQISDFESVTFNCKTDVNYWGKKMAVLAAPKPNGLPAAFEYNYSNGAITSDSKPITVLSTNNNFPSSTINVTSITMELDKEAAETLDGSVFEISLYIHMEHLDGDAEYTITNIVFNPASGVEIPEYIGEEEPEESNDEDDVSNSENPADSGSESTEENTPANTAVEDEVNNFALYIGIGVGAVVLIAVVAVLLITSKKKEK